MTCKIARPEPQTLFNKIRDMFSANVLGGAPVIPESNEWYVVTNDYAMQEQFYAIADQMWRETNPETACCENLYMMAARNGVYPRPATFSEGFVELSGLPGTSIPPVVEISTGVGNFISSGIMPTNLDGQGLATIRVRSVTPGPESNTSTTTTGTLLTPAPDINSEVTLWGGTTCGGQTAEDCEAFRTRYLDRLAYKPRATSAWIKQKLLEYPCATRVCTREGSCCRCDPACGECGCAGCGDKLGFYVFFDNSFPCGIPPANIVDDLNIWMFGEHQGYGEGQVEIGVCGSIHAPYPLYVNVLIDIVGCPLISQKDLILQDVADLFLTICPSMPLRKKQVEMIISQIVGTEMDVDVQFEVLDNDRAKVYISGCGDLEPECDYMPCLSEIRFLESQIPRQGGGQAPISPAWAIGPPGPAGPKGPAGPPGPTGNPGTAGQRGSIWFAGEGDPGFTTNLVIGDMYLDTTTANVWRWDGTTWLC